jgi:hypothetical protein
VAPAAAVAAAQAYQQAATSSALPTDAILEAAGDFPAGFAPRVMLPEFALQVRPLPVCLPARLPARRC